MAIVRGFEGVMSEVISFRLSLDNPREAQALEILRKKQAEGFSSRRVLTDALIDLATKKKQEALYSETELKLALEQVSELLKHIRNGNHEPSQSTFQQVVGLNDTFVKNVETAAKPGLNLE